MPQSMRVLLLSSQTKFTLSAAAPQGRASLEMRGQMEGVSGGKQQEPWAGSCRG